MTGSPIRYRLMKVADIPAVIDLEAASFPGIPPDRYWVPAMLEAHINKFSEGQIVAEIDGWIVGSSTSMRVPILTALTPHKWREITGGGYLTTHDPQGDCIYGTEIMVHPEVRRSGIGRQLYTRRKDLVRGLNARAMITGGRIPGYDRFADKLGAVEYVQSILDGDRGDRTLSAQLAAGFSVAGVMPEYITDPKSHNHATLLVWWNLAWKK